MWTAGYTFDTLTQLVASSDLVIEGEVTSESRDPHLGHGGEVNRLAHLRILETFKGGPPDNLTVLEPGWDDQGRPYIVDGLPPLRPDDRVLLFLRRLTQYDSGDWYGRVSSAGEFFLNGDVVTGGGPVEPAIERLKRMTPTELRTAMRAARHEADAKGIKAQRRSGAVEEAPGMSGSASDGQLPADATPKR